MAETIAIGFDVDQAQLQSTIDTLEKLGQIDSKTAAAFRAESEKTRAALGKGVTDTAQGFGKLDTAIKNVGVTAKTALAFDKSRDVLKTVESVVSLRSQLKAAVNEAQSLAAAGQKNTTAFTNATTRAAQLKKTIEDTNQRIQSLDPEKQLNSLIQLGSGLTGAFQAATGAMQLFGDENEKVNEIAKKFQGALNLVGGINQLSTLSGSLGNVANLFGIGVKASESLSESFGDAAQESASLSENVTEVNKGLSLVKGSTDVYALSLKGATAAQESFNLSILKNPYVIAAVAIIALVSTYYYLESQVKEVDESVLKLTVDLDSQHIATDKLKIKLDELSQSYQDQQNIRKLQGATEEDLFKITEKNINKSQGLIDEQISRNIDLIKGLEKEKDKLTEGKSILAVEGDEDLKKKLEGISKSIDEFTKNNEDLLKDSNKLESQLALAVASYEQFKLNAKKDALSELKKLNKQIEKEESDLAFKLRELAIGTIENDFEKRRQTVELSLDKEVQSYRDSQELKNSVIEKAEKDGIISHKDALNRREKNQKEFDAVFIALAKKFSFDIGEINLAELKKTAEDEKALREKNLNEILGVIEDQNTKLETAEINGILDRLKEKQAALKSQGLSEVEIARQSNVFIEEETQKSNIVRLNNDIETLEKKEAEIKNSGASTVAIEKQIADKRLELNNSTNKQLVDSDAEAIEKRKALALSIIDGFEKAGEVAAQLFAIESAYAEAALERDRNILDARLSFLDEQDAANKDSLDRRNIGERDFKEQEKKNLVLRKAANDEFRKKEAEAKRKADQAERIQALFGIAINTAKNIVTQPGPYGALIPFWVGLGLVQAAAVIAKPLPAYFHGTTDLKRGNNPSGRDTIPIMAHEGEAIIPTARNKQYKNTIEAVYNGLVPSSILENFVINYGRGERATNTTVVNIDHKALAKEIGSELSYRLRGRDVTDIGNLADLAALLTVNDGRRR